MNTRRYTKHGLTSEQVRQLSQYMNWRRDAPAGTSGVSLAENDKAGAIARWHGNPTGWTSSRAWWTPNVIGRLMYTITRERAGEIVAEARKEGW